MIRATSGEDYEESVASEEDSIGTLFGETTSQEDILLVTENDEEDQGNDGINGDEDGENDGENDGEENENSLSDTKQKKKRKRCIHFGLLTCTIY